MQLSSIIYYGIYCTVYRGRFRLNVASSSEHQAYQFNSLLKPGTLHFSLFNLRLMFFMHCPCWNRDIWKNIEPFHYYICHVLSRLRIASLGKLHLMSVSSCFVNRCHKPHMCKIYKLIAKSTTFFLFWNLLLPLLNLICSKVLKQRQNMEMNIKVYYYTKLGNISDFMLQYLLCMNMYICV